MAEKLIGWEISTRPCPSTMQTLADGGLSVRMAEKATMNPLLWPFPCKNIALQRRGVGQGPCSDAPDSREGQWLLPTYEGVGETEARREEQELSLGSGERSR